MFARVGIEEINTQSGPRSLDVITLRSDKFQGHVIGGDRKYSNVAIDEDSQKHSFGSVLSRKLPTPAPHIYINGGFFNVKKWADSSKSAFAPIGHTASIGGKFVDSAPIPERYKSRYDSISFEDNSVITSGPVLSKKGSTTFSDDDLNNPDYQFQGKIIRPGELSHAQHPNARSALGMPGKVSPRDSYRLAVATTLGEKRGLEDTGFTMPEWSRTAARLDRMNESPGLSINLDGGVSSTLGVVGTDATTLLEVKAVEAPPTVSTLVAFSTRTITAGVGEK